LLIVDNKMKQGLLRLMKRGQPHQWFADLRPAKKRSRCPRPLVASFWIR